MEYDAEEVMARIAGQLTGSRLNGMAQSAGFSQSGPLSLVHASAVPPLVVKAAYALPDLLAYFDRAFVETAFSVVLHREADGVELQHYLDELRAGRMSKVELLGTLRWSNEGIACGTHIDGLLVPYTLQRWSRKRWLGPVIGWLHTFVRLNTLAPRAALREAALGRDLTAIADGINASLQALNARLDRIEQLRARVDEVHGRLASLDALTAQVGELAIGFGSHGGELGQTRQVLERHAAGIQDAVAALDSLTHEVGAHGVTLAGAEKRIDAIQQHVAAHDVTLAGAGERIDALQQHVAAYDVTLAGAGERIEALQHHVVAHGAAIAQSRVRQSVEEDGDRNLDALYVAFEKRFRGSETVIRQRMAPYLEIIREARAGSADRPVLDLGCGHGEWLQLLRDNGIVGHGIDINALFVELCRGRGLQVEQANVLHHLEGLPGGSLGAITGMHIAEHLPFDVLIKLLDHAHRVLAPGGVLILETPNPENILVASHYFYLDPTHRNPLPPETLRWLVEARGFFHVRIERLSEARDMGTPELLRGDAAEVDSLNFVLALLRQAPDYAIIGHKA